MYATGYQEKCHAFDLLKEKEVDVYLIVHCMNAEHYNEESGFSDISAHRLTQQEFEFLQFMLMK